MATAANSGFSVSSFTSDINTQGLGFSRANQFSVVFTDPAVSGATTQATMTGSHADYDLLVKAAQFPGSTIAPLPINYGGRIIKLTGFRTFDNWTVTIINDEDYRHRKWIEAWMYNLAGAADGSRGGIGTGLYKNPSSAKVMAYNNQGDGIATWQFQKMWPTVLGDITLDWSTDAVEEYTVEFAYEYWTMGHSATSPMNTANTAKIAISTDTSSVIG